MVNVLIYWILLWAVGHELFSGATWPRHGIMAPQKVTKTSGTGALDKPPPVPPVDNNNSELATLLAAFKQHERNIGEKFEKFEETLNKEVKGCKDYIDTEIGIVCSRVDDLQKSVVNLSGRSCTHDSIPPLQCIEKCVVVSGLAYEHDEDLGFKLDNLFDSFIPEADKDHVKAVDHKRMGTGPIPLVKVALSREGRAAVLASKGRLRQSPRYRRVFIRPSLTQEQRNHSANTKMLAMAFPQLNFRGIHPNSINRGVHQPWQYQGQPQAQSQMQTPMGPQGQAQPQVHTQMFPQQGLQQSHIPLRFQANNAQIPQQQSHLMNYQAPTIPPPMRDGAQAIPALTRVQASTRTNEMPATQQVLTNVAQPQNNIQSDVTQSQGHIITGTQNQIG